MVNARDEQAEILAAYATGDDPAIIDPRALLATATKRIDLLHLTLQSITQDPQAIDLLAAKARGGIAVRVLLAEPLSLQLTLSDAEAGHDLTVLDIPPSAIAAQDSLTALEPVMDAGAQVRVFQTATPAHIIHVDEEMLVRLQLYGLPAGRCPLLHLTRHSDHGIVEQYARHFDRIGRPLSKCRIPFVGGRNQRRVSKPLRSNPI